MPEVECTHDWETCPVHRPDPEKMPSIVEATTCIYGGAETVDGTPWDENTSREVWGRVFRRL